MKKKKIINGFEVFDTMDSVSVNDVLEISNVEHIEEEKEVYHE